MFIVNVSERKIISLNGINGLLIIIMENVSVYCEV